MTILNLRYPDPKLLHATYIGREGEGTGEDGTFGNPFITHNEADRVWAVRSFFEFFYRNTRIDRAWRKKVEALRDKHLACFCAPKLCHGEVYVSYLRACDSPATRLVFVFGSNLAGNHGAGAALEARTKWGAKLGVAEGPTGDAYAIPTKDAVLKPLPLDAVRASAQRFIEYTRKAYGKRGRRTAFVITRVGCGLAGNTDADVAPMFVDAGGNCVLDPVWERMNGWYRG